MSACALFLLLGSLCAVPGDVAGNDAQDKVALNDYGPCGMVSLYLVTQIRDIDCDWENFRQLVGPADKDGSHSFADLSRSANQLGLIPVGVEASWEGLAELPLPAIVQCRLGTDAGARTHLVVLLGLTSEGVDLLDAPSAPFFLRRSAFERIWTGNVLAFARDAHEAERLSSSWNQASRLLLRICVSGALILLVALALSRMLRKGNVWALLWAIGSPLRHVLTPRVGLVSLAGVIALALFALTYSLLAKSPARCVFQEPFLDLGELPPGSKSVSLVIANPGDEALNISGVSSNCSCLVANAPDSIEPRATGVIQLDLSISPGPRKVELTVESNDPTSTTKAILIWHGKANAHLMPPYISVPAAPIDRPYERTIHLVYPGGNSSVMPRLEKCECESNRVEIRQGENNPVAGRLGMDGRPPRAIGELELHVKVQPPQAPESFDTNCKLYVEYGKEKSILHLRSLSIEFHGGELTPDVNRVTFLIGGKGPDLERVVRVVAGKPGGKLQVHNVPSWLDCSLASETDKEHQLCLRLSQRPPEGVTGCTLQICRGNDMPTPLRVQLFALGAAAK